MKEPHFTTKIRICIDGADEPKVTEMKKVREGAEATAEVSNHIIVLLQ